jgi:hypothetical protein
MATIYLTVVGNWAFPSSIILGVSEALAEEGRKKKKQKSKEKTWTSLICKCGVMVI